MGLFDRNPAVEKPPALRRRSRAAIVVTVTLVSVFLAVRTVFDYAEWTALLRVADMLAYTIPLMIFGPWLVLYLPRLLKAGDLFDAADGRLCTGCMHSLKGLPDSGRCPECAEPYHVEIDRVMWEQAGVRSKWRVSEAREKRIGERSEGDE